MKPITEEQFSAFCKPHEYHSDIQNAYHFDTKFHLHRSIHLHDVNKVIVLTFDRGCYGLAGGDVTIGVNDCNKPESKRWKDIFRGKNSTDFNKLNLHNIISSERTLPLDHSRKPIDP